MWKLRVHSVSYSASVIREYIARETFDGYNFLMKPWNSIESEREAILNKVLKSREKI